MGSTPVETLVLTGSDVTRSLSATDCREAIERAFAMIGQGRAAASRSIGFEARGGSFHAKAVLLETERPKFVAKLNGNFPGNPATNGLPTIQGVLVLSDALDGRPLAVMDSASLTAVRTAAATAVATRYLARRGSCTAAIVGCGLQGRSHVDALLALWPFAEIRLFDTYPARAAKLAEGRGTGAGTTLRVALEVADAAFGADVVVTCTTGTEYVLRDGDVAAGAFVAAVGADNPHKREIHPSLMRRARVVVDDLAQCAAGGDLHHALEAGVMKLDDVHGDLGSVIAGATPGRQRDDEIFVFDSTGIAIEDAAAAEIVYARALAAGIGLRVRLGD